MGKIFLLIFILINLVPINFALLCLKKYANTHCNEDNEEDIKYTEKALYYCEISCCAILSFVLLFFGPVIFKFGPIFITGISLICRLNKKQKLANIFCGIIIIPIIVCIILVGVIGLFQAFKPCEYKLEDNQMREVDIQAFNSKFTQYEGEKVTGAQVKSLINQVNTSNSSEDNINSSRVVEIVTSGFTATGKEITNGNGANTYTVSGLSNTKKYKVEITGYNDNGCINQITISDS